MGELAAMQADARRGVALTTITIEKYAIA